MTSGSPRRDACMTERYITATASGIMTRQGRPASGFTTPTTDKSKRGTS